MAEGAIKKLTDKGFGFIKTYGSKDLFFHSKACKASALTNCRKAQKSPLRKAAVIKGHVPRT